MYRAGLSFLFLFVTGLVAGCGQKEKGAQAEKLGAEGATTLSADVMALKPSKGSNFEDRQFLVKKADKTVSHTSGKGMIRVESYPAFTTSNKLDPDVLVIKLYTQQKKGPGFECSGAFGDDLLPIKRVGEDVKMLLQIYPKQVWSTFIKGGAKAGEKWEIADGSVKCQCEFVGVESSDAGRGFVVEQIISQNNLPFTKRRWYFDGSGGAMRLDLFGSGKGESAKYWIPLRQLIGDDWKGDRSPLALGEIGSK